MNIIVGMIIILLWVLFELLLQKTLRGKEKINDTSAERIYRWGRVIIGVVYLAILPFTYQTDELLKWSLILFVITLFGFKAILEWKYLKNSKDYLATGISLVLGVLVLYNLSTLLNIL